MFHPHIPFSLIGIGSLLSRHLILTNPPMDFMIMDAGTYDRQMESHIITFRYPSFPSAIDLLAQLTCDFRQQTQAAPTKWRDFVRYLISYRKREPLFLPPRKFRCVASNTGRWKPRPRDQKDRRTHPHLATIAITLLLIVAIFASI